MAFVLSPAATVATSSPTALRQMLSGNRTCLRTPTPSLSALKRLRPLSFRSRMSASTSSTGKAPADKAPADVTEDEWRRVLTRQEFHVLREKGTERPGTGEYDAFYPKEGYFACAACGNPLYSAESKFKSGCGWPAFDKCYKGGVKTKIDREFGMMRIEIMCNKCSGHLGHVFEGERFTVTNERHCVNSVSVKYVPESTDLPEAKVV